MIKIIKLDANAVLELLGEYFTDNFENIMQDENLTSKTLDFYFGENGQFLCISQDDEDYIELSNDNKLQILRNMPATIDSIFSVKTKFNKLTKKEFLKLFNKSDD